MTQTIRRREPASDLVLAILEDAELVAALRQLDAAALGSLVEHVGLEDSGELLSLATPAQLRGLADDDLWRRDRGGESLDAERFGVWLEVLVDSGPEVAADALAALDEDLLAHALAQHVMVLDLDRLAPSMAESPGDEDARAAKLLESSLSFELDEFLLLSRRYQGWDAVVEVVCELDRRDRDLLRRVLERLCAASMDRVAEDGLYTVLGEAESLAEDARGARDDRREQRGFVSVADARAFLAAARARPEEAAASPIARSYFRHYEPAAAPEPSAALERLTSILEKGGALPRALPASAQAASPAREALARLRDRDPELHGRRVAELVFLANVLVSAGRPGDEPLGRLEAVSAVLRFIDAGLGGRSAESVVERGLIEPFARGWSRADSGSN